MGVWRGETGYTGYTGYGVTMVVLGILTILVAMVIYGYIILVKNTQERRSSEYLTYYRTYIIEYKHMFVYMSCMHTPSVHVYKLVYMLVWVCTHV